MKYHLKSNLEKDFAAAVYLFEAPLPSKGGQAMLWRQSGIVLQYSLCLQSNTTQHTWARGGGGMANWRNAAEHILE